MNLIAILDTTTGQVDPSLTLSATEFYQLKTQIRNTVDGLERAMMVFDGFLQPPTRRLILSYDQAIKLDVPIPQKNNPGGGQTFVFVPASQEEGFIYFRSNFDRRERDTSKLGPINPLGPFMFQKNIHVNEDNPELDKKSKLCTVTNGGLMVNNISLLDLKEFNSDWEKLSFLMNPGNISILDTVIKSGLTSENELILYGSEMKDGKYLLHIVRD